MAPSRTCSITAAQRGREREREKGGGGEKEKRKEEWEETETVAEKGEKIGRERREKERAESERQVHSYIQVAHPCDRIIRKPGENTHAYMT